MSEPPVIPEIVVVDDDEGHAILVEENLKSAGLTNPLLHFRDGQQALDFFFRTGQGRQARKGGTYLVLLDVRMPKVDGVEVLRRLKGDPHLKTLPVIMLSTTDDLREVERCHALGCSVYLQKPVDYDRFSEAIRRLGMFVTLMVIPPTPRD